MAITANAGHVPSCEPLEAPVARLFHLNADWLRGRLLLSRAAAEQMAGEIEVVPRAANAAVATPNDAKEPMWVYLVGYGWSLIHLGAIAGSVYHGYRRNRSILWSIWWGFWGAVVPIITIPVAIAQGFGEEA